MKIAIADDEHLVRFSIKSMLNEMSLGLETGMEAANGEELLRLLTERDPDICLVDIRMPGMSGLDTLRRARQMGSRVRWIVLSSYAEFDYATEAMRLGASAYLLKPASPHELRSALAPLVEAIRDERRDECRTFERELSLALREGAPEVVQIHDRRIWACKLAFEPAGRRGSETIAKWIKEFSWELGDLASDLSDEKTFLSLVPLNESNLIAAAHCRSDSTSAVPAQVRKIRAAVSDLCSRFGEVRAADLAVSLTWLPECQGIHAFCEALKRLQSAEPLRLLSGFTEQIDGDSLSRRGAAFPPVLQDLAGLVAQFCEAYSKDRREEMLILSEQTHALLSACSQVPTTLTDYFVFRTGAEMLAGESLAQAMMRLCGRDVAVNGAVDHIVSAVERHIKIHFAEGILVPDIAAELGLSPNYLSSFFHKQAGMTISEKLAEVRLERARELLALPGSRVKEVSFAVGYRDLKHFTKLFKEKFGRLPSEIGSKP